MKPRPRRLALGGLAAIALLAPGCGSSTERPRSELSQAMNRIGEIRAGELSVRFTLTPNAAPTSPVGVVIRGFFALDRRHRLPILHITYTRLAGTRQTTTKIDSDGQSATITGAAQSVPLTAPQQQQFAATLQGPQGLGNLPLHIDQWVEHPHRTPGPRVSGQRTDQITGTVNLAHALTDLNQLSGGRVSHATRTTDTSRALNRTLRASKFLAVVGHQDQLLRRLDLQTILAPTASNTKGPRGQALTITLSVALTPQPLPR